MKRYTAQTRLGRRVPSENEAKPSKREDVEEGTTFTDEDKLFGPRTLEALVESGSVTVEEVQEAKPRQAAPTQEAPKTATAQKTAGGNK